MQDCVVVTGMIIKTVPIGEYDRRVVILSKERGKIAAFAKGARRQNSRFLAATDCFCFGVYRLYPGRDSYNMMETNISNYFEDLRMDFESAYYGMYFLEIADYYTRENNDERDMLKLLYQSMRALCAKSLDNRLVRYIFECKAVVVNGEFPGVEHPENYSQSLLYTVDFIAKQPVEKLYTFKVSDSVLKELADFSSKIRQRFLRSRFKSLEILETLVENPV